MFTKSCRVGSSTSLESGTFLNQSIVSSMTFCLASGDNCRGNGVQFKLVSVSRYGVVPVFGEGLFLRNQSTDCGELVL